MIRGMIEVRNLTKTFRTHLAADQLSFQARPGQVTAMLGPNGAGKSTTMSVALGLQTPTRGEVLLAGRHYVDLTNPMRSVGALVEGANAHPRRSVRQHLQWLAATQQIGQQRIEEILDLVDLESVANRQSGQLSTGMRQRLGLATALLGDPQVLILDEPANGLDPAGIRWLRQLMRTQATDGRTVLVASHAVSEVEATADRLVIIAGGRLVADTTPAELTTRRSQPQSLESAYLDLVGEASGQ